MVSYQDFINKFNDFPLDLKSRIVNNVSPKRTNFDYKLVKDIKEQLGIKTFHTKNSIYKIYIQDMYNALKNKTEPKLLCNKWVLRMNSNKEGDYNWKIMGLKSMCDYIREELGLSKELNSSQVLIEAYEAEGAPDSAGMKPQEKAEKMVEHIKLLKEQKEKGEEAKQLESKHDVSEDDEYDCDDEDDTRYGKKRRSNTRKKKSDTLTTLLLEDQNYCCAGPGPDDPVAAIYTCPLKESKRGGSLRNSNLGMTYNYDIDHIKELEKGGSDNYQNSQILCCTCHRIKTLTRAMMKRDDSWPEKNVAVYEFMCRPKNIR